MPSPLGQHAPEHRLGLEPDRHAVPARPSAAPRRRCATSGSPACRERATQLHDGEITYVSIGEGATSEGEFWETLNTASQEKLPLVILVEDNGYAISVPVAEQTPGGDISRLLHGFPDLLIEKVDGCDYVASHAAMRRAVAYARGRRGPGARPRQGDPAVLALAVGRREALQDARGARPRGRARSASRSWRAGCSRPATPPPTTLAAIASDVDREIAEATDLALVAPKPDPQTGDALRLLAERRSGRRGVRQPSRSTDGKPDTMVAAINQTLKDEMARTPHMLVFGEDVADCPPERAAARLRQGRRVQGDARPAARLRRATASSTRRWPKPTSSAARSAWPSAASSRSSRSSSSTTSGRR